MTNTKALFIWGSGVLWRNPADALLIADDSDCPRLRYSPEYVALWEDIALERVTGDGMFTAIRGLLPEIGKHGSMDFVRHLSELPGMLDTLLALKKDLRLYLISDIPKDWLILLPGYQNMQRLFAMEDIIYLRNCNMMRLLPDVFYHLSGRVGLHAEECLLFDADTKRTVEAIRHGFPSALILDPTRLRRECLLRGLLKEDYRLHTRPV